MANILINFLILFVEDLEVKISNKNYENNIQQSYSEIMMKKSLETKCEAKEKSAYLSDLL